MTGMSRTTGQALADIDHLRQSIADILTTPIGSRVMRRDYGSLVPELIDQPDNGPTRVRLYAAAVTALMRWEPRLQITKVGITAGTRAGQCLLDIEGTVREANQQRSTSLQINLTGASA